MILSYIFYVLAEILTLFMHYSPDHGEHLYDHYLELIYLHFIKVCFWSFILFLLFATYSSVSSFSLTLCVVFCALDKIATSPSLFVLGGVFITCRLSLVVVSGGYSSLQCTGFSLHWLLLLWSTGSRRAGFSSCSIWASVVAACGL